MGENGMRRGSNGAYIYSTHPSPSGLAELPDSYAAHGWRTVLETSVKISSNASWSRQDKRKARWGNDAVECHSSVVWPPDSSKAAKTILFGS